MQRLAETLSILADGEFHSGEHLAKHLKVSRGTVWKQIDSVRQLGLDVYAVRGKGYRLATPFELLNRNFILKHIIKADQTPPSKLDLHWEVDSTNARLMELARQEQGLENGHTCLAELQSQGRGRRGRTWQSPIGGNIYLSQYWRLADGFASTGGLSLAVAVAIIRALRNSDIRVQQAGNEIGVKWPNDIVCRGKKLAGILLEITGEPSGLCHVVIGVGINLHLSATIEEKIDQPCIDLKTITGGTVDRNRLTACLITELLNLYQALDRNQLQNYIEEWKSLDSFHGKHVVLKSPKGEFKGVVRGVDANGAIQLAQDGKLMSFHSGEVSLRKSSQG